MAQKSDYGGGEKAGLSQFRKNRFFSGKLMTPRDMEAEQEYHAERLHTLARFVIGRGVVHGLAVQSIDETDDGLEVTIEPGVAVDGHGRPIVVDGETTTSLPNPTGDELSLYIQYDEVSLETVPVPDTDDAIDDESTANRTVEVFELTYRETTRDSRERTVAVEIPDSETACESEDVMAHRLLERYHAQCRSSTQSGAKPNADVFLGSFERTPDGGWTESEDTTPREFVYDHDLLFGTIIDHITDTDNPHRTPIEQESPDIPDDITAISERLDALEADLERVEEDQSAMTRYIMRKTIKDRARFVDDLADRLERQSGEGESSRLARDIAAAARADSTQYERTDAYRRHIQQTLEQLIELGTQLEGVATEASLERYLKSVTDLQSALEDDDDILALAETQDRMCEAIAALEVRIEIVPDK